MILYPGEKLSKAKICYECPKKATAWCLDCKHGYCQDCRGSDKAHGIEHRFSRRPKQPRGRKKK